jgi:hypothetical protein
MATGLISQIMYGEESTWGTRVVPNIAIPLKSETLTKDLARLESEGIIPGFSILSADQWNGGPTTVGGTIQHELHTSGIDVLLKHMFGSQTNTGSGPYTHVYKPTAGTIDGKGLTIQKGVGSIGSSTAIPFDFTGCKITEWEIACAQGEIAQLGITVVGKDCVTGETLATPTYTAAGTKPFKFNHADVSLAGTGNQPVMSLTINGNNGLKTDRRFLSATAGGAISEPLEEGLREYGGTMSMEFADLTIYNAFIAGTELAFVATFDAGAPSLAIEGNIRYDGETPQIGGREVTPQNVPFKFIRTTGGLAETAIKATTVNSVATV